MSAASDMEARLHRGEARFAQIEKQLEMIISCTEGLPAMQQDVAATREIVEAWTTAKNIGRFLKWFGPVAAAAAAVLLWTKAWMLLLRD